MSLQQLRAIVRDILAMSDQIRRAAAPPIDQPHLADLRKNLARLISLRQRTPRA
ncbi:hypothetical protein [Sphingomonas sp. TDK1]|uniref:hypothetical protein n=1 Tax=Sphingomonas sp. TDK1 TaxID=453247 RepID=UPI000A7AFD18|nr:hypothetical protein [Sphingomonas sp. TDK1]